MFQRQALVWRGRWRNEGDSFSGCIFAHYDFNFRFHITYDKFNLHWVPGPGVAAFPPMIVSVFNCRTSIYILLRGTIAISPSHSSLFAHRMEQRSWSLRSLFSFRFPFCTLNPKKQPCRIDPAVSSPSGDPRHTECNAFTLASSDAGHLLVGDPCQGTNVGFSHV